MRLAFFRFNVCAHFLVVVVLVGLLMVMVMVNDNSREDGQDITATQKR